MVHRFKSDLVHFIALRSAKVTRRRSRRRPSGFFCQAGGSNGMPRVTYRLKGKAWRYAGQAAWVFVLPLKAEVRNPESIGEGDSVAYELVVAV